MKNITILSVFLILLSGMNKLNAQIFPINHETAKIEYVKIVDIPDQTKLKLFAKMQEWISTNKLPLIYVDTTEHDKLIFTKSITCSHEDNSIFSSTGNVKRVLQYDFTIELKDNKARFIVKNLVFVDHQNAGVQGFVYSGIIMGDVKKEETKYFPLEDYWPIDKTEKNYRSIYQKFFTELDQEIKKTMNDVNTAILKQETDW